MAIHNVKFEKDGEFIDSYLDLGLILSSRDIEAPKVKDHIVDIVGADGSIDLTEVLGRLRPYVMEQVKTQKERERVYMKGARRYIFASKSTFIPLS